METIYGYLERITFVNEENHFTVARLQEKAKKELTTIVGNLAGINPGESLRLYGKWVHNAKYGSQFQVEKYETVVPATVNGIEKYLGSGLIKGIGPVMAKRIVKTFGLSTLDVIETAPEELAKVDGIGVKRIEMIKKAWEEQKEIKEIMVFLQSHGVSAAYSARIFKRYGKDSIENVRENPYRLAADIHGIGFITADRIAQNMGVDPNSILRVKEGIIYVLNQLTSEGHVYYPLEPLLAKAAEMLKVDAELTGKAVAELLEERRIRVEELPGQPPLQAVYLPAFYTAETNLARLLLSLAGEPSPIRPIDPERAMDWVAGKIGTNLAEKQKEALVLSTQNKVLIITGGPGTGKTTIIKAIIRIFRALNLRVLLAAPTGRAAKRMQEATGYEAKTIHRLLEYSPRKGGFERNQESPLEADVIILDESSMIDLLLMYNLVKAIPPKATLILVGDINQLPSVGPGNVLKDLIECGRFKVVTLTEIFRQARESRIVTNAHLINKGMFPDLKKPPGKELADFYFIEEEEPEKIINKILALCLNRIPKRFGFHPVQEIQVLTPMHRGKLGVMNLNLRLQEFLNPGESRLVRGHKTFKVNDKVMQVVNNYDKSVYNGDVGTISRIDLEEQEVEVNFEGRLVTYDFSELDELVLAYAISIHKSQGSEYPAVIIPVVTQHYMLLQRNLIYTGITRGKKLVILIGSKRALAIAVKNNKTQNRFTWLKERLAKGI
ncbi:MAG TPA: ATP-dependent RecD-like DNA helicase [Bacillota bacterium]|jgi:exodeoxyribonuclease V alpha subunit|nr:ATP-dependent RecD-like DNA helicase [Peptococcaceae bacterium MAG4]NLW38715.1 ATP-dependent RecD-like DNA helicase [Peptococcaceae bacterium]HPZ44056.1 ATP-dependent RecD-like DNA helicase [Bacillota bacterium]HQD75195.1 ATP-dependent RecD-like DNA helicase [Bacillota bacterium]HUM58009.1 ATP-dependent RecD-like DNA helicase [Bacillota bacterium]